MSDQIAVSVTAPAPPVNPVVTNVTDDQPLTLSELRKKLPPYVDETIEGLGKFRLHRLGSIEAMNYTLELSALDLGDGKVDQAALMELAVRYIAKSLGGDYDSDEGRQSIEAIGIGRITKLLNSLVDLMGVGGKVDERIEEAKND